MKKLSLRVRLILAFLCLSVVVWSAASALSWMASRKYLDEFFDTYQLLFAKQLSVINWNDLKTDSLPKTKRIFPKIDKKLRGKENDDAIGFAVFNKHGEMIFHDGEDGEDFIYIPNAVGFVNQIVKDEDELWRIVWVTTSDESFIIAVGQELEYRDDAAIELVSRSLMPWVIGLIALIVISILSISKEFKPLKFITENLSKREPDDLNPVLAKNPPSEIEPLIMAMNNLFLRIQKMLDRERSFISDAAHELRSPLAALKVQTEVALLASDDKEVRESALEKSIQGINRSARLVEQLLTLSRLEAETIPNKDDSLIDWHKIIKEEVSEQSGIAEDKNIKIDISITYKAPVASGRPLLWGLLLRNLLNNAIRYSSKEAKVDIIIDDYKLIVLNTGVSIDDKSLSRLGERFFRPPGQEEEGSGLGLSIVKRIAKIHGCSVRFINSQADTFAVVIEKAEPESAL